MGSSLLIIQIAPFFWKAYKKRKAKKNKSVEKEVNKIAAKKRIYKIISSYTVCF